VKVVKSVKAAVAKLAMPPKPVDAGEKRLRKGFCLTLGKVISYYRCALLALVRDGA
jgi:hypothetical protein